MRTHARTDRTTPYARTMYCMNAGATSPLQSVHGETQTTAVVLVLLFSGLHNRSATIFLKGWQNVCCNFY